MSSTNSAQAEQPTNSTSIPKPAAKPTIRRFRRPNRDRRSRDGGNGGRGDGGNGGGGWNRAGGRRGNGRRGIGPPPRRDDFTGPDAQKRFNKARKNWDRKKKKQNQKRDERNKTRNKTKTIEELAKNNDITLMGALNNKDPKTGGRILYSQLRVGHWPKPEHLRNMVCHSALRKREFRRAAELIAQTTEAHLLPLWLQELKEELRLANLRNLQKVWSQLYKEVRERDALIHGNWVKTANLAETAGSVVSVEA